MTQFDDKTLKQLAAGLRSGEAIPAPPARERLLAAAFADRVTKETRMPNPLVRLFAGAPPTARFALAAVTLLAVLGLSLILPRDGQISPLAPAWAATEGYLLALDFGEGSTQEGLRPVLDQLEELVNEFKAVHELPTIRTHISVDKRVEKHSESDPGIESSRVVAMVELPDAALVDALKTRLATVAGLPAPELTDATWFSNRGIQEPSDKDIQLSLRFEDKKHVFHFPAGTSEETAEAEINRWLALHKPEVEFDVDVLFEGDEDNRQVRIMIQTRDEE